MYTVLSANGICALSFDAVFGAKSVVLYITSNWLQRSFEVFI